MDAFQQVKEKIITMVEEHGRAVMTVFPLGDPCPLAELDPNDAFSYTIGNAKAGLPELLLVGMVDTGSLLILNMVSDKMKERGRAFDDREIVSLGAKFPVCLVGAGPQERERMTCANWFNGDTAYPVMQIVACDTEGRFPWDPGCAEPYCRVHIPRRWFDS